MNRKGGGKEGEVAGMVDYAQLHYILSQKWPYATWCNTNKAPWNIQSSDKLGIRRGFVLRTLRKTWFLFFLDSRKTECSRR